LIKSFHHLPDDSEKTFPIQIEHLNENNYLPRSTQVRAFLRHRRVLDVTENETKPKELEATASEQNKGQYKTELEAWEAKAASANAIRLPTISEGLMTYVKRGRSSKNLDYSG